MSLFSFFKKAQKTEIQESNILLAMPIFNDNDSYEINKVTDYLKLHWELEITDIAGDNEAMAFKVNDETLTLAPYACTNSVGRYRGDCTLCLQLARSFRRT